MARSAYPDCMPPSVMYLSAARVEDVIRYARRVAAVDHGLTGWHTVHIHYVERVGKTREREVVRQGLARINPPIDQACIVRPGIADGAFQSEHEAVRPVVKLVRALPPFDIAPADPDLGGVRRSETGA